MDVEARQDAILQLLRAQGRVAVDDLATRFGVSSQTVRNDLRELSTAGMVTRTHGGARLIASASNRNYAERRQHRFNEKEAMGVLAASLIPNNCSITLNIGTSTEQVAKALTGHTGIVVLSNNINIINLLMGTAAKDLRLIGGSVRQEDGAIVGEDAVDHISRFKVDYAVIGASALDADGAILDYDAREVAVARAILLNSRTRILVCDRSKFERTAPVRICDVAELDYVVTDAPPPDSFYEAAKRGHTEILTLDKNNARHEAPA